LIVESGDRYKIISRYDLVNYSYTSNYQAQAQSLAVEQRLTGAILYVTAEDLPVVYLLEGHGENTIPYELSKQLEVENFQTESLNLLTQEAVPEDAHSLVVFAPERDLTKDEEEKIRNYLENQGRAIFIMKFQNQELPNFESLLKSYGITVERSLVVEGDNSMHAGNLCTWCRRWRVTVL
jgi:ABC-2 type transport system permease protein